MQRELDTVMAQNTMLTGYVGRLVEEVAELQYARSDLRVCRVLVLAP